MQSDVTKVRQAYAEVSVACKRLERDLEEARAGADTWYKRAHFALQKGEEDLAREALMNRKAANVGIRSLTKQVEVMKATMEKIYGSMTALEAKINEVRGKRDEFESRARTAKASLKVDDVLGDVGPSSALGRFERMRAEVEELEVKAEVTRDMMFGGHADSSLENKFQALESKHRLDSVDDELRALKDSL